MGNHLTICIVSSMFTKKPRVGNINGCLFQKLVAGKDGNSVERFYWIPKPIQLH